MPDTIMYDLQGRKIRLRMQTGSVERVNSSPQTDLGPTKDTEKVGAKCQRMRQNPEASPKRADPVRSSIPSALSSLRPKHLPVDSDSRSHLEEVLKKCERELERQIRLQDEDHWSEDDQTSVDSRQWAKSSKRNTSGDQTSKWKRSRTKEASSKCAFESGGKQFRVSLKYVRLKDKKRSP